MSEPVNKPEAGFKTQEEIRLKVSGSGVEAISSSDDAESGAEEAKHANGATTATTSSCPAQDFEGRSLQPGSKSDQQRQPDEASVPRGAEPSIRGSLSHHRPSSSGLKRHKAIVASCAILSCSFLGFSAFDLQPMIGKQIILTDTLQTFELKKKAELPPGYSYTTGFYSPDSEVDESILKGRESSEKLFPVAKNSWGSGRRVGFADSTGKIVIPPQFSDCGEFSEGLAHVRLGAGEGKAGYIDQTGQFVIEGKFDNAKNFHNGAAPVSVNGKYGLIDKHGNFVLKPSLDQIEVLGDNFLGRTTRGKHGILSPTGKWLLPAEYSDIRPLERSGGGQGAFPPNILRPVYSSQDRSQGKVFEVEDWTEHASGLVDDKGNWLLPAKFDQIVSFENGIAAVKVDGKIGFAKSNGDFLIKPQFDRATSYADLIAVQNYSEPWQFMDKTGKFVTGPKIDSVISDVSGVWLRDGLAPFSLNEKVGYVNSKGEVVIEPKFAMGFPFVNGHAPVWVGNAWRFIDRSGNLLPISLQALSSFYDGRAIATMPGPLYPFVEMSAIKSTNASISIWSKDEQVSPPRYKK